MKQSSNRHRLKRWLNLGAILTLSLDLHHVQATTLANPPTTTEITALAGQSKLGVIFGGVTMATTGKYYVAAAAGNGHSSSVQGWTSSDAVLWSWSPSDGANFLAVPVLSSDNARLFIGSDSGKVYCLDAPNTDAQLGSAAARVKWTKDLGTGGGVRVRAQVALSPDGTRLYVHTDGASGGYLHALNTSDGIPVSAWGSPKNTGNTGCTGFGQYHSDPAMIFSAGPVVDTSGNVFAASSSGSVYGFNASGTSILSVNLNTMLLNTGLGQTTGVQVEAAPALGTNGWLYVATRRYDYATSATTTVERQTLVAINPAEPTSQKVRWFQNIGTADATDTPGMISSPILDRAGFVYATEFGHHVEQFDALYGTAFRVWTDGTIPGKQCATPTLTEDGLLLILNSGAMTCDIAGIQATRAYGNTDDQPLWQVTLPNGVDGNGNCVPAQTFGSPAVRSSGNIYFADSLGRVWRVANTTPMMEGPWPTLAGGNRRSATPLAYAWQITELFGTYDYNGGATYANVASIAPSGRPLGNCYGLFAPGITSYAGTYWNPLAAQFATYNGSSGGYYSQNTKCEAANSIGDIVGVTSSSQSDALVWPLGALGLNGISYIVLPKPAGGTSAYATAATEDRKVIGYVINGSAVQVAIWAKNGNTWQRTDVTGPDGNQAYAFACSISGMIVGKATFETSAGAPFRAFRTAPNPPAIDTSNDLGTLADTSTQREFTRSSEALDVREDWGIVGRSQNFNGVWRAFSVGINSMIITGAALPGLIAGTGGTWTSRADALNRLGIRVGTAQTNAAGGTFVSRAVQWDAANGITDLNALLPANSGWVLTSAVGVSDTGFIIGYGTKGGATKPFLLFPKRTVN